MTVRGVVFQIISALFISRNSEGVQMATTKFQSRIFGGTLCNLTDYPFMVAIFSQHSCGGSLVTLDWVLTAAHCIHPYRITNGQTIVRSGFNNWLQHVQVRCSKRAVIHSKFKFNMMNRKVPELRYDIALILVNQSFTKSSTVNIVTLPQPGFSDTCKWGKVLGSGVTVVIPGGLRGFMDSPLRCVDLGVVGRNICALTYPESVVDDTIICTAEVELGKDACHGDSGGPLLCEDSVIIGIVSFGEGCGLPGVAATYTRVESYLDFINQTTRGPSSSLDHHFNFITKNVGGGRITWNVFFVTSLSLVLS